MDEIKKRRRITRGENNEVVEATEDKVWVTVTHTKSLQQYENIKIDAGYSRTIKEGEDPLDLIREMQDELSDIVLIKAQEIKEGGNIYKKMKKSK